MRRESRKYLDDMQRAARSLTEFTRGKSLAKYQEEAMLRAAEAVRGIVVRRGRP